MSNDKAETVGDTEVVGATGKPITERNPNDAPGPAVPPTERPWTADYLLPSIRFRERNA